MRAHTQRRLRGVLVAVLLAGVMVPAMAGPASAARFVDVPDGHQFLKEITWLSQEGITTGYTSDGTFRPKGEVSREAFAAYLYRMAGRPSVSLPSRSPFSDVPKDAQFYKEIVWADQQNITNGWSDGTFRPRASIDRNAMAAFLYRFEGRPSYTPPGTSPFRDLTRSSPFYKEIAWLKDRGITNGYTSDNTFRPYGSVTREATAAFLYRLAGRPPVTVPSMVPKSFTVRGAGFGHGVGMSQYGAWGMALEGYGAGEILRHYYQGTSVSTVTADQEIKVEVFGSGSDSRNRVDLVVRSPGDDATDDGQWRLRFYGNGSNGALHETWYGKNNEVLKVTRDGTDVVVERENGDRERASSMIGLHWEGTRWYQPDSAEDPFVELRKSDGSFATHGQYRHGRMFISVPSTSYPRLIASNWLDLNTEYLYGIAEVPSSWDIDALQAQAIVARGYALRQAQSYSSSCDCHLYDDTRSQNFSGWRKENEGTNAFYGKKWVDAVNRTNSSNGNAGKVLTYGGSIATTYYFSSSGGRTENSDDIWVSQPGYLRAVDDKWSLQSRNPNASWTRTLTQSQAASIFGLSNVVSIQVTQRTSGSSKAAASRVTATSSTGQTRSITGPESIRSRIVGGKSPWIWSFSANY